MSNRRRRWLVVVAVVLCVGVGGFVAFRQLLPATNARAIDYANLMRVNGYVRIDNQDHGRARCGCDVIRWYIGPANADPTLVFAGPQLSMFAGPKVSDPRWDWLVEGAGRADSTGSCSIAVARLRRAAGLYNYPALWHLSQPQIAGWNDGTLDVLQLSTVCQPGGST